MNTIKSQSAEIFMKYVDNICVKPKSGCIYDLYKQNKLEEWNNLVNHIKLIGIEVLKLEETPYLALIKFNTPNKKIKEFINDIIETNQFIFENFWSYCSLALAEIIVYSYSELEEFKSHFLVMSSHIMKNERQHVCNDNDIGINYKDVKLFTDKYVKSCFEPNKINDIKNEYILLEPTNFTNNYRQRHMGLIVLCTIKMIGLLPELTTE
jgi:hypothetical protein